MYKYKDFHINIKLPMSTLKSKKEKSPLVKMYEYAEKKLVTKYDFGEDDFKDVVIFYSLETDEIMIKLMEKWFINFKKLDKRSWQFKMEMAYLAFDLPRVINPLKDDVDWLKKNTLYIKKRELFKLEVEK